MAGKKDDAWSDSDDDNFTPSTKSNATTHTGSNVQKKGGPLQLEFQSVKEIRQSISKNESFLEAPPNLLQSISQIIAM
jgi:hypothetical protein